MNSEHPGVPAGTAGRPAGRPGVHMRACVPASLPAPQAATPRAPRSHQPGPVSESVRLGYGPDSELDP